MTNPERLEHNKAFEEAAIIVQNEILLHERPDMPKPGWWLRRKLKRALVLFDRVLELKPENWSAMWLVGKTHQRLGDLPTSLSWLEKAYQANPSQTDIAREASMLSMDLGRHDTAIIYAHRAIQIEPENAGLHANLALAYLLAGDLLKADTSIKHSLTLDPDDTISKTLDSMVRHFTGNRRKPPTTTRELQAYWTKNRI